MSLAFPYPAQLGQLDIPPEVCPRSPYRIASSSSQNSRSGRGLFYSGALPPRPEEGPRNQAASVEDKPVMDSGKT